MKHGHTYRQFIRTLAGHCPVLLSLAASLLLSGCLRRPLWIYTDEFRQVELITNWDDCGYLPSGMTAWFAKNDYSGQNRRVTDSNVEHTWLNLSNGYWSGVVFDYSPDEYAGQYFIGMSYPDSCYVRCRPSSRQPMADEDLYGGYSVPESMSMQIPTSPDTYMYIVSAEPDPMCADTLHNMHIITGVEGDLIPWKDRETYGETLEIQTFYDYPKPITWKLRVFLNVRGINYMSVIRSTFAGLSDGNRLSLLRHTPEVCLHSLETWEVTGRNSSTNTGTLGCTIDTFGFPGIELSDEEVKTILSGENSSAISENAYAYEIDREGKTLQLNLQFLLRDELTVINYHFSTTHTGPDTPYDKDTKLYNMSLRPEYIRVFPDQRVIRIDIPLGCIELPYVDAKDSAGFDATVSPWEDGGTADVGF